MGMVQVRHAAAKVSRRLAGERGFTLIETLVVVAILLIVLGALVDGFASVSKAEVDQTRRASDQQAARQALDRMRKDIHCASGASVSQIVDPVTLVPQDAWLLNLQIPNAYCNGVTDAASGATGVQWCTAPVNGSTTLYGLYRTINTPAGTTCDAANANFQVDYLTRSQVWTYPLPTCAAGQVQTVGIDMPVNRDYPKRPSRTYELTDSIALRNAPPC